MRHLSLILLSFVLACGRSPRAVVDQQDSTVLINDNDAGLTDDANVIDYTPDGSLSDSGLVVVDGDRSSSDIWML